MQDTDRPSLPIKPRQREVLLLAVLAAAALVIAWALTAGGAALAGPLLQDSPIATPQEQLSPLPTAAPPVEPAPATTLTPQPQPAAAATAEPPIPMAALIGVMLVIGLIALVVGLRRR